jgi:hypothetical protein
VKWTTAFGFLSTAKKLSREITVQDFENLTPSRSASNPFRQMSRELGAVNVYHRLYASSSAKASFFWHFRPPIGANTGSGHSNVLHQIFSAAEVH